MNLKDVASGIGNRLTRRYRVEVVENESLTTSKSWMVRPLGLILLGLGTIILVGAAAISFGKLTGLSKGGANAPEKEEYQLMLSQVDSLKKQLDAQNAFIESFRKGTGIHIQNPDSAEIANMSDGGQSANGLAPHFDEEHLHPAGDGNNAASSQEPLGAITSLPNKDIARVNLMSPVDGIVTQGYDHKDKGEHHFGIDLVADENSIIRSVSDGVVIFSEYSGETGYVIAVMHPQYNLVSFYKHNSRVFKTTGSYVFAGEAIAVIGHSGKNQSGTHLHFELWYNGNPINPQEYIIF